MAIVFVLLNRLTGYPRKHLIIFRAMSDDDMRTIYQGPDETETRAEAKAEDVVARKAAHAV
ncbi:hypothetical protein GD3902_00690 [Geobacillus thermodenitrificans]|uniref:hypothetical protein n=1 Tax=Geobacillus thermodenitrificans TaxID=33940 RepID=UPI0004296000|nr:hypothetical protein [Geobacillus thermodenitrificans]ARA96686.1 hypothetical protein GD3902_00690 [Geobacillus thermodenitrificans]